jgi:2-hydroxy-3-oxopropionate reductase
LNRQNLSQTGWASSLVGFVGLGNMGLPMAQRLIDAGHTLAVCDIRPSVLVPLVQQGARVMATPSEVADSCSVVVMCLLTSESIADAMLGPDGVAQGAAVKIVVNLSTIGKQEVERLALAFEKRGIGLVDCPVSGGPPGARAGTLSVMVSGSPEQVHAVRGIVDSWGVTTLVGDRPGMAQVLKLTNNILSAVALAATAEAFVMGGKAGVDLDLMTSAINAGSGRNSMTLDKIPGSVLDRSFAYGGPISTLMKDIELAIEQGQSLGVPMRVCEMAREVFRDAVRAGMSDKDVTEIVRFIEQGAGFELPRGSGH